MLKLRSMLAVQGIETGGLHETFADDVYAYARVGMGVAVVTIVAEPDEGDQPEPEGLEFTRRQRPDFYSGVVYSGFIERRTDDEGNDFETLVDFRPNQRTGRLFDIGTERQESPRLAVYPYTLLADQLSNTSGSPFVFSQYTVLRPSMYSGTMKKLVQTLMGYGKFGERGIYGDLIEPVTDPRRFSYTPEYLKEIEKRGTQIRFDWRWIRTHGLTRASDGRWWLVEIRSGKGVHAMPLQLYESTTTEKFRQAVLDAGDQDAIEVLDLFGGFPTGEGIPLPTEFDSLVRAGLIVQGAAADALADFYSHIWYSSWHGWAFSESGREAHNTAFRVDEDRFQTGVHYAVRLSIGPTEDLEPKSGLADSLKRHAYAAREDVGEDFKKLIRGVLFKIDRLNTDQVRGYLEMPPLEAFNALDALTLSPIANFTATVARVSSGRIYMPSRNTVQFKFYSPEAEGVISHDGRAEAGADIQNPPNTDTTVHVFFVGENLHYAKMFIRPGIDGSPKREVNDETTCGLVGTYTETFTAGFNGAGNGMYTETYDERASSWSSRQVTTSTKTRIGPIAIGYTDRLEAPFIADVFRAWAFKSVNETVIQSDGSFNSSAVVVPRGMRESYYYAVRKYRSGDYRVQNGGYEFRADAYRYVSWRNLAGFTGFLPMGCAGTPSFPACWTLGEHPAGCGPVKDRHIWFEQPPESDDECLALTNAGPWAGVCDQVEPMAYLNEQPPVPVEIETTPARADLTVYFVSSNDASPIKTSERRVEGPNAPFLGDPWFVFAPDETGGPQFLSAQQNEMGSGTLINYAPEISTASDQLKGSPQFEDMKTEGFTFIGVING
jgi:hypothetical protein